MDENSIFLKAGLTGQRFSGELIIDAHIHIGPYHNFFIPAPTPEDILACADKLGVRRMFASGMAVNVDVALANQQAMNAHHQFPERFWPYTNVNAAYPDEIAATIEAADKQGFYHFKLHRIGAAFSYDHPDYQAVYEYADEKESCILFHTWNQNDLRAIPDLAKKYRRIKFLLAHAGVAEVDKYIEIVKSVANVYLELAGSPAKFNLVEFFVKSVGAERILYGSDMPFINPNQQIGKVLFSRISDDEKRLILGLNAERLFNIPES